MLNIVEQLTEFPLQSVQFSRSVMSDSLQPHESQHASPPCPSPTPGVYSNSCPLSQWCHPTISSFCRPLLLPPSIFPIIRELHIKTTVRYHLTLTRISSVQFSHSVMSDSLWPHGLQHARPLCPLPTPGVHPNPCPLSQWWHLTISSSFIPFSSCPQSFPASGSFQMSQLFTSCGQSIEASASVLLMNIQGWFPWDHTSQQ